MALSSGLGTAAGQCAALGENDISERNGKPVYKRVTDNGNYLSRIIPPRPSDEIPPRMCRRCGIIGHHANAGECIAHLRDLLAYAQA